MIAAPGINLADVMDEHRATWGQELIAAGKIVQDDDTTVAADEAERRFLKYIELVDGLTGNEGRDALAALFRSIQMKYDYGAYQAAHSAMGRFPAQQFIDVFVEELPALIKRQPDWAGDFLCGLANGRGSKWDYQIAMFNEAVLAAGPETKQIVVDYVRSQESDGWLSGRRRGVLCTATSLNWFRRVAKLLRWAP